MNDQRPTDRHSTARVLIIVALVTVVLSAGVYLLESHIESKRVQIEIQKRLDAIRDAGQPVTAQDLAKLYPDPPPEQDAVLLLKPALAALVVPEDSTNLPFFGGALPTGTALFKKTTRDEIQMWMDQNQKAFDSVPSEKLKGVWIGSGFSGGFTNFPHTPKSKINSLVRLLCLNVVSQTESEHSSAAINSLQRAWAVGAIWKNDSPVDLLLRTIEENMVCESLEYMINRSQLSKGDLTIIEQSFPHNSTNSLIEVFMSERCFQIWELERVRQNPRELAMSGTTWKDQAVSWFEFASGKMYRDSDYELILDRNERRLEAMRLPVKEQINELQRLESEAKKENLNSTMALKLIDGVRNYSELVSRDAGVIAHLRTAQVALALERWRLTHNGNVPDSLAGLAPNFLPAIPIDPFDDQPLRYKKLARGYVVYSIGPNFTDDGGKEKPADAKDTDHYDITFTVER